MELPEFSVASLAKGDSVGESVAGILEIIERSVLDYRQGHSGRLVSKIPSVEAKLGRKLKT